MASGRGLHRGKLDTALKPRGSEVTQYNQACAKSLELSKVIRLLEDPLTANLKERHLFELKKLLKRSQIGFLLKDLTGITKIFNVCAEKAEDHPEYVPMLREAIKICSLPFLKEKTSDELTYAQDVIDFLSHMGCLMRVSDAKVRQQIVECVKSFYDIVAPKQLLDGLQPTSPGYRLQLLERSDLAQTMLLSMAALENQQSIKLELLHTLLILSSYSDMNCASMLKARGAEMMFLHMNEPDPSGQILFCSSGILWNLLERGNKEEVAAQLSMECVISLKEAFINKLTNASRHSDLELRNDLLVITTLIADNPNSFLIESLFAKQLVALATFPELQNQDHLVRNLKLKFTSEDFQMKELLLNLLVLMSKDSAALQLFKDAQVMEYLLILIRPPSASSECSGSRHWSSVQQEELLLQGLATLATIARLMLDDFMFFRGNASLLLLLGWCLTQDEDTTKTKKSGKDRTFGQGHSFHSTGGRGSKKAHMRHCIRVLRSVTSLGEESVYQDLSDQGLISQLLDILMQMKASPDEEDIIDVEIKTNIQLILSTLCESDMHRKELFGSEGVEMTVHFLKKGSDKFYSGLGHNKLILTTVDSVRSCIIGCHTTEDYFLAKEGVFLLLDLLNSSPRCVHCIVLATLLELCDNPNTLPHILSWRDGSGQTAPGLLLQLWIEEEKETKVSRTRHGTIADPQRPILTLKQQEDAQLSFPANGQNAAVLEISEGLRAKIYFIFCKLGFQNLPGLSTKHHVTLCIVRNYQVFKAGEIWDEIIRELRLEGVRPISPDQEALNTICKISEDTARRVMAEQNSILEQRDKEELGEEELMYSEITCQRELTAKAWDRYVSKTSNYETMKEVKAQREKHIQSKPEDAAGRLNEHFIERVMYEETTDAAGPAGIKVTLARTAINSAGQDCMRPAGLDPE
ncbi:cilia- and flagella-associated protein 69-like [Notolabrus celidotus]|uniref:cilia- and flagella-associated protein 69-like n=1 Tax=Notolabrus celidotus TaxID=1203425 RepID=UPI00148F72A6|nr:cilia- and flagella-associated protein 69-like [Notolabrus celidotus]XP_034532204.1 cilia- and flagella-associated protein 69-like [Notolabrus celidotus]